MCSDARRCCPVACSLVRTFRRRRASVLAVAPRRRPTPAPLAQLAEQLTLNQRVRGSSPWRRTKTSPQRRGRAAAKITGHFRFTCPQTPATFRGRRRFVDQSACAQSCDPGSCCFRVAELITDLLVDTLASSRSAASGGANVSESAISGHQARARRSRSLRAVSRPCSRGPPRTGLAPAITIPGRPAVMAHRVTVSVRDQIGRHER